jgi:hypothetical protein
MHLPTGVPRDTRMDSPFSRHFLRFNFLEGHGAFACDQDLQVALTVRIRDLNRKFGGLQDSSGLTGRLACFRRYPRDVTEEHKPAAAAARDVDDAAPLVTAA